MSTHRSISHLATASCADQTVRGSDWCPYAWVTKGGYYAVKAAGKTLYHKTKGGLKKVLAAALASRSGMPMWAASALVEAAYAAIDACIKPEKKKRAPRKKGSRSTSKKKTGNQRRRSYR